MDKSWLHTSGFLGADPEWVTPYQGATKKELKLSLGQTEYWQGKDGERKSHTTWFAVHVPEYIGTKIAQFLHKGSHVGVVGTAKFRTFTPQGGGGPKMVIDINAADVNLLDKKEAGAPKPQEYRPAQAQRSEPEPKKLYDDEDLPF